MGLLRRLAVHGVPDHDIAAHHDRRAGPEDLRDQPRRGCGAPDRSAAALLHADVQPVHPSPERRVERDPAGDRHPQDRRVRRGRVARGAQGADRPVADRRQARHRRGEHAHRRLPPARAAGAPGDDAGPGGRDRRPLRARRDRAAALRLLRPHPPGRHRGREPRPREGHRARQRARPAAAHGGPGRADRRHRARGADRPGDQAARRPARRPPASAQLAGRGRSTSTAAPPGSSRSRTSSRRSSARSPTRPTRSAAPCAGWPTATGSCAATSRSPT